MVGALPGVPPGRPLELPTFSAFPQGLHVGRGLPPGQDVPLRVPGEDVPRQAEDEALDELGLLVFLLRETKKGKIKRFVCWGNNCALVLLVP